MGRIKLRPADHPPIARNTYAGRPIVPGSKPERQPRFVRELKFRNTAEPTYVAREEGGRYIRGWVNFGSQTVHRTIKDARHA